MRTEGRNTTLNHSGRGPATLIWSPFPVQRHCDSVGRLLGMSVLYPLALCGCVSSAAVQANLDATLWVQTSAEYGAVTRSVYGAAARDLVAALRDSSRTAALEQAGDYTGLPPAIILDIDETVLDNAPYQARLLIAGTQYADASWADWVHEERAEPVPGALEFVRKARELGIVVFYVTNRDAELETSTRANLERRGFPLSTTLDDVLSRGERPEWTSDKTSRRRVVTETHRVLMLVGDDLSDFVDASRLTTEARDALASTYEAYWGDRWRMLPGPTYGSWERALYGFERELNDEGRLERKTNHLDPAT